MSGNKFLFGASFVFMLAASGYFGYLDRPAAMALAIVGGAIGMAFANLEKFSRIKGAGFEAELKKAVEQAYATTSSLKGLAGALTHAVLGVVAGEGRWGGMGLKRKFELRDSSDAALKTLGLDDSEIRQTHELFNDYLTWDHGSAIANAISKHPKVDNEIRTDLNKLSDYNTLSVAAPEEFSALLKKHQISDLEIEELITDFRHFKNTKALRRPEKWFKDQG